MIEDMPPEEYREHGRRVVDFITEYLAGNNPYPILSRIRAGDIRAELPSSPPVKAEAMDAILDDFETILMPGMTHWNRGGFMAYFANSASAPGILGETLCAALNQNAMLWKTSPAATELEEVVTDWVRQMLGLAPSFQGIITDTASISSLLAIAAARESIPGMNVKEDGLCGTPGGKRLRLYCSEQAHSSIDKAAITLGIGLKGARKIAVDATYRLIPEDLERAIQEDIATGWLPFCVVATVGTTSSAAIDPVEEIAAICRTHGLWLHVDGAYAVSAAVAPEFRYIIKGCEHADSLVVNPHKWLFTPVDCSLLYVQRPDALKQAFSFIPAYLTSQNDVTNYMDWGVQLGRRFRALKLWMVIRYFGHEGLAQLIRQHVELAREFSSWIEASSDFETLAETKLSLVCFRAKPVGMENGTELDQFNERLLERVNADGRVFLSHMRLREGYCLRLAVGNIGTNHSHIAAAWELLQEQLIGVTGLEPATSSSQN